ncbi:hypothetical protein I3843_09G043900 [Carya illinoinensis]|uniref:Uncharacterized protein n=1 Tax=Carya illinoinensis TaxID=32201 RepID=A0A8T1PH14_CARIL|nr:hypothetical protein I3760_09G043000 [Carya illinoinensis]KAG6641014.1 hypothetical protein CIPAW_09G043500 [Carya illinoinensis]KAG6694349.1 hypothetical protein I3842_09G043500 [Carya illinoinensis]KAG7962006.1 hypothetical protein I3843_09G043900 [Carya illinoinensis]
MAGLQYNFFPTDFFYPRPQSVSSDAAHKVVLPLQQQGPIKEATKDFDGSKALIQNNLVKFHPLVLQKNQTQG